MYIFCMCPFLTFVLLFKITLPSLGWLAIGYTVGILCVPKRSVKECRDTGPRTISLSQSRSGLIKSNQIVLYAQVIEGQQSGVNRFYHLRHKASVNQFPTCLSLQLLRYNLLTLRQTQLWTLQPHFFQTLPRSFLPDAFARCVKKIDTGKQLPI